MSGIPYTIDRRPDTGVNNVELGIWLFLASEVMLFGGLFSAYFMLRAGSLTPWLPLRDHVLPAFVSTLNLAIGTACVAAAARSGRYRLFLAMAMLAALAFCARKMGDHQALFEAGRGPASSTQMAVYFLLTGVHMLHVFAGVIINAWVMIVSGGAPDPRVLANRLRATALYWYFVDAVWVVMLVLLYVV